MTILLSECETHIGLGDETNLYIFLQFQYMSVIHLFYVHIFTPKKSGEMLAIIQSITILDKGFLLILNHNNLAFLTCEM